MGIWVGGEMMLLLLVLVTISFLSAGCSVLIVGIWVRGLLVLVAMGVISAECTVACLWHCCVVVVPAAKDMGDTGVARRVQIHH